MAKLQIDTDDLSCAMGDHDTRWVLDLHTADVLMEEWAKREPMETRPKPNGIPSSIRTRWSSIPTGSAPSSPSALTRAFGGALCRRAA